MNQTAKTSRRLTLNEVLAVALIWGAVIYGLSTRPSEARTEAHAVAQSCGG
ncbi:hypothetical protein P7B02_13945 [Caulobacter segnis]|uniref:hypothetical protein n=1 Tax=Caulobacter segnis TaxID=88688 RepID=UPI00241047D1|nr:hypothetical protein [Caulobacter segnis]MDG2522637.1 hypothetical protein [Caulobacter segnis]